MIPSETDFSRVAADDLLPPTLLEDFVPLLDAGDSVIDGGTSHRRDDMWQGAQPQAHSIHYLDVGPLGGWVDIFERGRLARVARADLMATVTPRPSG